MNDLDALRLAGLVGFGGCVLYAAGDVLLLSAIIASALAAAAIAGGGTRFPTWMGAINPVTMTAAWLLLKRALPTPVAEFLQGAGFNIAYGAWFAAMTMTVR